jgi:hypothetical protein
VRNFDAFHLNKQFLDEPKVLLDFVVHDLDLQNFDQPEVIFQQQEVIHGLQSGKIYVAFIDDHSAREAVVSNCAGKEFGCCCFIPVP